MKPRSAVESLLRALGRRESARMPSRLRPGKVSEPHSFKEKVFKKKKKACVVCKESIEAQGLVCKVCKVASHKKCEAKVPSSCQPLPPPELVSTGLCPSFISSLSPHLSSFFSSSPNAHFLTFLLCSA
nr:PREDICTED: tensin-2-like isoform X2 [Anolis carolinensis]|eukprot:XP_016851246.1 PREDICTED: tensin-2-like isoform X2 [Anolis carolinensis]